MAGQPSNPTKGSDAATPIDATTTLCQFITRYLRIRLLEGHKVLQNQTYELITDDDQYCFSGKTDNSGIFEVKIPETIQTATLNFNDVSIDLIIHKDFPTTQTIRGIQARLNNLGYNAGEVNGVSGSFTKAAIRAYQRDHRAELPDSNDGEADPKTQDSLASEHGC